MTSEAKLRLLALLYELEEELRQLGWWNPQAPSVQALQSQQPFCVDTLDLAQWLQWIFIPRMHSILAGDHPLPTQCAIHEMAEVSYREQTAAVASLLRCLKNIDTAITAPHIVH